tara:strand:- start:41 stop:529 length:489 start_codon:yes stop_codon:yes gene_type:complete
MQKGTLVGNKSTVSGTALYNRSSFGTLNKGSTELSSEETLYLVEKGKLDVSISSGVLFRKFSRGERNFPEKYAVFKNLRGRGYVLKSGLKFGCDFRVYDKGQRPGKAHAKWLLFATKEGAKMSWKDFSGMNRVANSTRKNLLIAIVDSENSVSYFEVGWKKL